MPKIILSTAVINYQRPDVLEKALPHPYLEDHVDKKYSRPCSTPFLGTLREIEMRTLNRLGSYRLVQWIDLSRRS